MADKAKKREISRWPLFKPFRFAVCASLLAGVSPLAGCGGPTYGTGVSSGQQLVNDFSNITKWGSLSSNKGVDSNPRPPLVPPTAADLSKPLPPPQESLAASNNPQWPESPEQRRARLRAEATANRNNPNYVSPIIQDEAQTGGGQNYTSNGLDRAADRQAAMPDPSVTKEQTALYRKLKAENSPQNAAKTRKYLTQPPLDYFQPSPNAPVGDTGESEDEKAQNKKHERTSIFGK